MCKLLGGFSRAMCRIAPEGSGTGPWPGRGCGGAPACGSVGAERRAPTRGGPAGRRGAARGLRGAPDGLNDRPEERRRVERRDGLSAAEFRRDYLYADRPVVMSLRKGEELSRWSAWDGAPLDSPGASLSAAFENKHLSLTRAVSATYYSTQVKMPMKAIHIDK